MSQHARPKNPLEALQGMVNGILIETGKALRAADKDSGTNLATAYPRLRSSIPAVIDNFHQVLDEFEMEIVRAKAVLLRDLGEQRAKRKALETPIQAIQEEPVKEEHDSEAEQSYDTSTLKEESQVVPVMSVKQEQLQTTGGGSSPQGSAVVSTPAIQEPVKVEGASERESNAQQKPSPSSTDDKRNNLGTVGLGINNADLGDNIAVAHDIDDSAIDSLFDMPGEANNNDGSALTFDDMDFSIHDSTDNQNVQEVNNDFDLSTFGNAQDFNMPEDNVNTTTHSSDAVNNPPLNTQGDDSFAMNATSGGDDMELDLDLDLGMPGEDSMFDDMYTASGDYEAMGGDDDMKHGEFDAEFFGLS